MIIPNERFQTGNPSGVGGHNVLYSGLFCIFNIICCRYPQGRPPSTWSIVLRANATCAYTWRAPFAHLEPMHSLTAAPCPIISEYGSKVKDRITCRSIGSGPPRPPTAANECNQLSLLNTRHARKPTVYVVYNRCVLFNFVC